MALNLESVDFDNIEQFDNEGDQNLVQSNMSEALKINPDQHAKQKQISIESGVPTFAVDESVEQTLNLDKIDFTKITDNSPKTARYLSNFDNSVVAQDDIDTLESIERIFNIEEKLPVDEDLPTRLETAGSQFIRGATNVFSSVPKTVSVQASDMLRNAALGSDAGVDLYFKALSGDDAANETLQNINLLTDPRRLPAYKSAEEFDNYINESFKVNPEFAKEFWSGQVPQGLGSALAFIATTAITRTPGGAAMGYSANAQSQFEDALNNDASIEDATKASQLAGVLGLAEVVPISNFLDRLDKGTGGSIKKAIFNALKQGTEEAIQESVQTIWSNVIASDIIEYDPERKLFIDVTDSAGAGFTVGALMSAVGTMLTGGVTRRAKVEVGDQIEKVVNADDAKNQADQTKIDQINEKSTQSKLRERDKESFKQFVEESDGENNTHVFIDGAQTALYLQGKTPEEIEADPALKILAEQKDEAANLGGDVHIPVADFAAEIAGTEHYDALRDSMTMSDETISPFRQDQAKQETESYIKNIMNEAQESASEYVEAQNIYTTVRDQLIDTGQVTPANASIMAQVVPAWATAQARRQGKTVQQVYTDAGLVIEGPQTGERARLEGEQVLSQEPVYKEAPFIFDSARDKFLNVLPEDADFDDVTDAISEFGPEYRNFINALERDDWLGFDFPSQAINAALSGEIENFEPSQGLKQSIGRMINAEAEGKRPFAQPQVEEKDLFVAHNLSAENIIAAKELGGLAAPSLAVARTGVSDFTGFGEVTLLADPSLLKDPKARTFDADIYSPRQPRAVYDIDQNKYSELYQKLDPDKLGIDKPDIQSMEDTDGPNHFQRSVAVEYHWLQQQGKAPKLKNAKIEPIVRKADKLGLSEFEMVENEDFIKLVTDHYQKKLDELSEDFDVRAEKMTEWYFKEDGSIRRDKLHDIASEVRRFRSTGGKDIHQLRDDISKKMRVKKTRAEYEQWATETFNKMVTGKKLFKGFTPSGNRKYSDYNLQNVVREMTQQLQAGENFFYGAGTVRSKYANELKTIKQIQAKRDEIISEEDMQKVKDESADVFMQALDDLRPFYKFDANSFGYANDAGAAIIEGRSGLNEAFNMTEEAQQIVDDLLEYLVALPTSYFEAKVQRAVGFEEFDTAIVPKGMRKDALQALKDAGLKIKTYDPKVEDARADVIAKQQQLLFQKPKERNPRGYYDPANSIIRLTESADLSTFLHEFAHFMYEMEVVGDTEMLESINNWYKRNAKDVAKEAEDYINGEFDITKQGERKSEKPVSITSDDVVTYLDNDTTGDTDKDAAIRHAVHEQFARGFETYLMEGKAPSIELRNAFRAFARWLARIYQAMRGQLNVNLTDEMRQVFDRLLATEEQIQAARARARVEPMFTDAAMAGMTEDEFADYQKRQEKVADTQSETLRDKIISQLTRQTKAWWKEEKQDIIDEETETLSKEQVYVTRARLRDGDIKLDHATVKEMIGEEKTDKLGRKSITIPPEMRGMTAKGMEGIHPDEAAALFGYSSGSEMLLDLVTAPTLKAQAETNAEAAMVDRHGDILTDGTIEKEADEAVRDEERGKLILHELKMITRGTNAPVIERNTVKALATERIGKLSFREIHPGKYRKAEIRAAQESTRMLAEGNREGAADAKMRQVMNYYLGMAATNAKNETVKIVDRMARYNKKNVREAILKVEGGYWDQLVRILSRFEFRKSATLKEIESLNTWMKERIENDGDGLTLSNAVLNESYVTHWKNVPFSDLEGINDSVKNIEHVARYANKLTRMQEEIDFNKLVDRWTTSMDEKVKTRFKSKRTDVAEGRKWGRWFMAQMTKIPYMASWLDGGERAGLSHQIMVQPFTEAYNAEIKLWAEAGKPVMDAIEGRSKADMKRHNQKIYIPEIEDNLYGHQILAVALNTGNQSNLKKMLLGEGWADPENESEITFNNIKLQAVLSRMTRADWELVQTIWDQMETLYPQLAEVHRRTTGLVPPKIESTPVETEFGTFKGGYYPVKYDPNRDHRAALNEDKLNAETESMFSNNASIQASVNTGATNERTGYYAPIRLSLDVVPAHFQETIHYITHHDPVREINRLTRNKQVAQMIKDKLGPEEYAQLRPWLNDIAKDGREAPTKMFWDSILQRLRFGVTLGTMGFKASTGIIQISGLSNSIAEVGMAPMMQSMRSILGSPTTIRQAWDFAVENSEVLEHRTQTMDREIRNAMKRIEGKRGLLAAAQEVSMKHIALIQTYMVDLPTWHAAYIKGMKEWGDETRSFQYADWVIENVQGSGVTKDMARIMRGQSETGRMFTMFMTFFSSLWNMERDLVKGAKTGLYSTSSVAAKAMFLFTIPVLFEMLIRGELGEPEPGDDDDRLQTILTKTALYPVQSIPFIRDIASATTGEFGYNISPLQMIIEQGTRTIPELITRGFTDEEITKGQVKGAAKFAGAVVGVPGMNQMWATGEHLYDVIEDGEEFTVRELLFGPERK